MIVGVINGSRILITKYKSGFRHNALVAGFTEIGETDEETVRREVMEETGLRVKNIQYYKSQPWGIASDILMGFYCDADGSTEIHRDDRELGYAEWVERKDIILQPTDHSLTCFFDVEIPCFRKNDSRLSEDIYSTLTQTLTFSQSIVKDA